MNFLNASLRGPQTPSAETGLSLIHILALLEKGKACGGAVMTATLGEDGSVCWDGRQLHEGKAVRARQVVNTVGAGDSFIAGFMEGVIRGLDTPGCLRNGAALAAQIVAQFNPY